ncbi:MAG: cytochrome b/b6 domain-containing protein [Rhodobacteraceae bacterium]|nr:cytochrome b/b6 domain-containing protein [Paracoccaceae bacterium]
MARPVAGDPPVLWDGVVRISHWAVATVVIANAIITDGGSPVHVWLGWLGMIALAIRLIWGILGPHEARFASFPPRPRAAIVHMAELLRGKPSEYPSHNPAGAMMIYALWSTLAAVILSGLILTGGATPMEVARQNAAVAAGDWAAIAANSASDEEQALSRGERHLVGLVHETGGNLLLILAVLHVGGVLAESVALRRNLIRPMVAGNRQQPFRKGRDAPGADS